VYEKEYKMKLRPMQLSASELLWLATTTCFSRLMHAVST